MRSKPRFRFGRTRELPGFFRRLSLERTLCAPRDFRVRPGSLRVEAVDWSSSRAGGGSAVALLSLVGCLQGGDWPGGCIYCVHRFFPVKPFPGSAGCSSAVASPFWLLYIFGDIVIFGFLSFSASPQIDPQREGVVPLQKGTQFVFYCA